MRPTAKVVLLCILNAVDSDRKKKEELENYVLLRTRVKRKKK